MPLNFINEESKSGGLARSLGKAAGIAGTFGAGSLINAFKQRQADRQAAQEAQQAEAGRRLYAQQTGTPFEATAGLGLKDVQGLNEGWAKHLPLRREQLEDEARKRAYEMATSGAKEKENFEADQRGAAVAVDLINQARDLSSKLSPLWDEKNPSKLFHTKEYKKLKSVLKTLGSNKYVKDISGVVPDIEIGREMLPMLDMLTVGVAEKYKLNNEINIPAGQEDSYQEAAELNGRSRPGELPKSNEFRQIPSLINGLGGLANSFASGVGNLPATAVDVLGAVGKGVGNAAKSAHSALVPEHLQAITQQGDQGVNPDFTALQQNIPRREDIEKRLPFAPTGDESDFEKSAREWAGDVGEIIGQSIVTSGSSAVKNLVPLLKSAGIVQGAGNFAKFLNNSIGGEKEWGDNLKVGVTLATAFKMAPTIIKQGADKIQEAKNIIGDKTKINPDKVWNIIEDVKKNYLNKGDKSTKDKLAVTEWINSLISNITRIPEEQVSKISLSPEKLKELLKSVELNAGDLLQFKQDVGKRVEALRAIPGASTARGWMFDTSKKLGNVIKSSPGVPNEARKLLSEGDQIFSSASAAQEAMDWFRELPIFQSNSAGLVKQFFGIGISPIREAGAQTAGMLKTLHQLYENPALVKVVDKLMVDIGKHNPWLVTHRVKALEQKLRKEENK